MMDELIGFLKENDIEIAALTIPKSKAVEVADILVRTDQSNLEFRTYRSHASKRCDRGECTSVRQPDAAVV